MREFAEELKRLKMKSGKSLRQMAEGSGYSFNALGKATSGDRLPSLPLTLAFVRACGGDERLFQQHWHAVSQGASNRGGRRAGKQSIGPYADPLAADLVYVNGASDDPAQRFAAYLRHVCENRPAGMTLADLAEQISIASSDLVCWLNGTQLPDSTERVRNLLLVVGAGNGQGTLLVRLYEDACRRPPTVLILAVTALVSALRSRGKDVEPSRVKAVLAGLVCSLLCAGYLIGRLF